MTQKLRDKQIPGKALLDIDKRMRYGFDKHGDYRKNIQYRSRQEIIDHIKGHLREIEAGVLHTKSRARHTAALACQAMLLLEKDIEEGR